MEEAGGQIRFRERQVREALGCAQKRQGHGAVVGHSGEIGERFSRRFVSKLDVIHVDVAPAAGFLVHNLEPCPAPQKLTHRPVLGFEQFPVATGRGAHHGSIDDQVHAGAAGVTAATDEKGDPWPIEVELRRDQSSLESVIAAQVGVDQTLPEETTDRLLVRQGSRCGPGPESAAFDRPVAVTGLFEVGKHDGRPTLRPGCGGHGTHRGGDAVHARGLESLDDALDTAEIPGPAVGTDLVFQPAAQRAPQSLAGRVSNGVV